MKPSSSGSERTGADNGPEPSGLFDGVLARGGVRTAVGDRAWVAALLEVEVALARAHARVGRIDAADAEAIASAARGLEVDIAALGEDAAASGNPVVPLVRALSEAVGGSAAAHVHEGATSQDVLDSATMIVARTALGMIIDDVRGAADRAAILADDHRATIMAGRTLLQQAAPITFGLKAAGWLAGLDTAWDRLDRVRRTGLAVQLGGAVGTLAALGPDGVRVLGALATELDLAEPVVPWHTERTRIADIGAALGETAGTLGTIGYDLVLLAQTEVGEASDARPDLGGSSTLPNKRNPVAAVAALAGARRAPGLVATLLATMIQEHERAAGTWHAEWRPLRDLFESVGSTAAWTRDALDHLEIDVDRMRANVHLTDGLILSERVAVALAPRLGGIESRAVVARAATTARAARIGLREALVADPAVAAWLTPGVLDELLEPVGYLGSADAFVDRALAAHEARARAAAPR